MTSCVSRPRLRHQAFAKFDEGYLALCGDPKRSDPGDLNVPQHNAVQRQDGASTVTSGVLRDKRPLHHFPQLASEKKKAHRRASVDL